MKSLNFGTMKPWWMGALSLAAALSLFGACTSEEADTDDDTNGVGTGGGGGSDPSGTAGQGGSDAAECTPLELVLPEGTEAHLCSKIEGRRCLPADMFERRAISYSGYRTGQDPRTMTYPSKEEIKEDLALLTRAGFSLIRLFDSGTHGQRVLEVIAEENLDFKVQLGIWIDGPKAEVDEKNQADIERGIALANDYSDIVIAVSVGNEVLDDWSSVLTPPEDLAAYIEQVREAIPQPITTDDMYPPFQMNGNYSKVLTVLQKVDYVSVHAYAFIDAQWSWNWRQKDVPEGPERTQAMMDAGLQFTKDAIKNVRFAMSLKNLDLPITIGEAGWKTVPTKGAGTPAFEDMRAHPVNQKIFYDGLMRWVYGADRDADSPSAAFYFEAFDEPWKGMDDGWGLFDVNRVPKYTLWCDLPDLAPADAPSYSIDDAVSYVE